MLENIYERYSQGGQEIGKENHIKYKYKHQFAEIIICIL